MRLATIQSVLGVLLFSLVLHTSAQAAEQKPTRGDGLAAKLAKAKPDLEVQFSNLRERAEGGDVQALHQLSRLLVFGVGVQVDLKAAFAYAKKSAEGGYGLGQFHMGEMYRYGTGTDPDVEK